MATVADILQYIESIAPPYMAEDWDNVGLLCGRKDREVARILVALDPFRNVIDEAIDWKADLIVTHHPIIFMDQIKALNEVTETTRNLLTLVEHRIAAINAHTNLDLALGGINDVLAATLGLENIQIIHPEGTDENGDSYGLLRCGTVAEQSLSDFLLKGNKYTVTLEDGSLELKSIFLGNIGKVNSVFIDKKPIDFTQKDDLIFFEATIAKKS